MSGGTVPIADWRFLESFWEGGLEWIRTWFQIADQWKAVTFFAPYAAKPEQDVFWWPVDSLHHWHWCGNTDLDVWRRADLSANTYSQEKSGKLFNTDCLLFQWLGFWKYCSHSFSPLGTSDISSIKCTKPWTRPDNSELNHYFTVYYKIHWVLDIFPIIFKERKQSSHRLEKWQASVLLSHVLIVW